MVVLSTSFQFSNLIVIRTATMFSGVLRRCYSTATNVLPKLQQILSAESVSVAESVRQQHGHDESHHKAMMPDIVVKPNSVEEVCAVVRLCNEHKCPVIPFGAGTGLEGGVTAPKGGVSIDMCNLDQIVAVNAEDFDCTVQAGVSRLTLNSHIRDTGLWFPMDPGADAFLCGMCATGASGTNALKYGTMKENILNLDVVLPSGELISTRGAGRRPKLFSVLEFLDEVMIDACNQYSHLTLPVSPSLFLEFHGNENELSGHAKFVADICAENNGSEFKWSHKKEERDILWKARHNCYYAAVALRPGSKGLMTDVCVPISKLPEVLVETKKDIDASNLKGPIVGHVGDGNFHCTFPLYVDRKEELDEVNGLIDRMVKRALAVDGTCTGEHGVGLGKRKYMELEFGAGGVALMKHLKNAIDPNGIMNPGKMFLD